MQQSHNDTQIFYRRREAARDLAVSQSQLIKWERQGVIRAVRIPGLRSVRYPITEVRSLAARILNGSLDRDGESA